MAGPLPPPPISGRATKKDFFAAFLTEYCKTTEYCFLLFFINGYTDYKRKGIFPARRDDSP